ncbi:unnamed protein product [Cuscuta campestris]|uniref:Uncharacterized protein n=1 Tax=Cuscuta campestris TaxID=132261 RepID=A0A484KX38_9ASTE|nr:unnamed protein product [Cuscuta campestris]
MVLNPKRRRHQPYPMIPTTFSSDEGDWARPAAATLKYCPGFLDCWSIKSCPIVLKFWEAFKDSWIFNLNGGDRIPTVQS